MDDSRIPAWDWEEHSPDEVNTIPSWYPTPGLDYESPFASFTTCIPVSRVEVWSGECLEAVVSWQGDVESWYGGTVSWSGKPITSLEVWTAATTEFEVVDLEDDPDVRLRRLAQHLVPIEEALDVALSWFPTYSEVKYSTHREFRRLISGLLEDFPHRDAFRERVRFVKENYPEVVTLQDYYAWVEEHITGEKIYIFPCSEKQPLHPAAPPHPGSTMGSHYDWIHPW